MDEGRKSAYKKVAWILSLLFLDLIASVPASADIVSSIGSISANTLYYIQGVYVYRSDACDIRFCTNTACTQVVTPSYFWVESVTQLSSTAYRANIYVSFSSSYSQLYMQSYNATAYLTPSSTPAKTTTPGQQIYAPNGARTTMTFYTFYVDDNAYLYLRNTNNEGYYIRTQANGNPRYIDIILNTIGQVATVPSPATVSIEWGTNYLTFYWPGGSQTITPGITRTTNLVPSYAQSGGVVTGFSGWALNTSKSYSIIDSTLPTLNVTGVTWQNTTLGVNIQASDNALLWKYEVKKGSQVIASGNIYASSWSNTISIPYSSIDSLPATLTVLVYDIANNVASIDILLTDTVLPTITASISVSSTLITIQFSASDNTFLRNYAILLNNEQLTSENIYAQTFSKTVTYSTNVLIGKTNPTFTVVVYDAAGNSNSTTLNVPKTSITIAILDENRNAALNFTNFQELYIYLVSENQKTYIVLNGQYLGNLQNNTSINLLSNLTETIRITWLYKNYPDYYVIEIMPIIASVWGNPIVVGIPGLINNTTIPYLYEFLVLSNDKKPVIIERVNPKMIKLASITQYPYDRYLTASTFLQREIYNLYTVESGVLVFLSAVDGGRAQAVNIDALLAQKKPVAMIYGVTLDCEWLDNKTMRVAFKTVDPTQKLTTINVYVNNTLITTISQIANEMQGIIAFDQLNVTITNQTRIKIEAIRENIKIVREFLGYEEVKFRLPVPFAIGLGICLLLFGLTLLGIESVIRYFGFVMLFMVIAVVALSDMNDMILRIVLVVALVLIVVFIAANLRGERE